MEAKKSGAGSMKVKVSLDNVQYREKPSGKEIPGIKKRAAGQWQEIGLEELADLNGNKGRAIIPGHLEGGIKAENCRGMQLFVLDFDGGCTFAGIKEKCDGLGLGMAYAYHTFRSSEKEERFRVVFACEGLVEDIFIIRVVLQILHKIFPECDKNCKNMDRIFLGGKGLIFLNPGARMALVQLPLFLLKALDVGNHYIENLKKFANKSNVFFTGRHPAMGNAADIDAILGENVDSAIIHITGESTKSPFFIAEKRLDGLYQSHTCPKEGKRKLDITGGGTLCGLYNDFEAGEGLSHDARFAIFTNLLHVNGGVKHFLEITRKFYGEDSFGRWKDRLKYYSGYYSKRCSGEFCPYYAACENAGTPIDTMAMDRRVKSRPEEYVPVREVEECLQKNLEDAFRSPDEGMHLIRAQTGIGKTRAYIKLAADNPGCRFIIALPTNVLKEEVRKRLTDSGVPEGDVYMTASVHGNALIPAEVQAQVSEAHGRGLHNMTKEIIGSYLKQVKEGGGRKAVEEECGKILEGLHGAREERIVVTTHAYLAQMDGSFLKGYTVIIDEDFLQLQAFGRMYKAGVSCLEKLAGKNYPVYSDIASGILQAGEGEYRRMGTMGWAAPLPEGELERLGCSGEDNVNDLVYAGAFVRMRDRDTGREEARYFCPPCLPKMKYIVLSATLNYEIYRNYFAGKMEVYGSYPEKKAAYKGRLVQYTYHSLGRNDLEGKKQVFQRAKEIAEEAGGRDLHCITFKAFQETAGKVGGLAPSDIHFGNSTGVNGLSGKDIVIIGTPYKAEECYKLVACYLGADVNREGDKRPVFRRVGYKGRSFLLTTYKDPLLREVQLYSLESELEQCIGRARLLREGCKVYLFSAFPCGQAQIHIKNYLHGVGAGDSHIGQ